MKLSSLALLAIIGTAAAGRPQVSIQVRDGSFAGLDGLEPSVSWSGSASASEVDLEYGIDSAVHPTDDITSLPKSIWGKASKSFGAWSASVRGEVKGTDMESVGLKVTADNADDDISIKLTASAGSEFSVSNVEAMKGFDSDGARVTVNPRYNLVTEEGDVVIGYSNDKTDVTITASRDAQSVKISQQIDDDNRVAPTLSSDGAITLEYERSLGDDNSLTATWKPNESIDVQWKDASWTANVNMPVDGTSIGGADVSIKREVNF